MSYKMNENLKEKIVALINDEKYFSDTRFILYLCDSFSKKKLGRDIPTKLFSELMTVGELDFIETAWLLRSIYDYGKDYGHDNLLEFNPSNYFTDVEMKEVYEYYHDEDVLDKLVFKNVTKVSDFQYIIPFVSVNDLYKFKKNELISYDWKTQRESKVKILGTKGTIVREIQVNQHSIDAITDLILKNKFTSNMISLYVPLIEKNEEDVVFDEDTKTLIITPNYSEEGKRTYVNIIDGFHRYQSSYNAVKIARETGKELTNGFVVSVNLFTEQEANDYFVRENTYNAISKTYLDTFNNSSESKFIKTMLEYSECDNIFKDNIMRTFEECKAGKKLSYNAVLEDGLRLADINTNNIKSLKFELPKIVKFVTLLINKLMKKYNCKNYLELRKNTPFVDYSIFIGYIKMATMLDDIMTIDEVVEYIVDMITEKNIIDEIVSMKLNNKNYNAKNIASYFENLIRDVI